MEHDVYKNMCKLRGELAHKGFDCWRHIFTGINKKTGEPKTFFIEYYLLNPQRGRSVPVFPNSKEKLLPSLFMVKAGAFGANGLELNRYFGTKDCDDTDTILKIATEDCFLSENNIWGKISISNEEKEAHKEYRTDVGSMTWSLRMNKSIPYNLGWSTSDLARFLFPFDDFWHVEGLKTAYEGLVTLNGESYVVLPEKSNGYADKHWGANMFMDVVQAGAMCLKSKITGEYLTHTAFCMSNGLRSSWDEKLGECVFVDFCYEGKHYEINPMKPWTDSQLSYQIYEDADQLVYHIHGMNKEVLFKGKFSINKEELMPLHYYAPNGKRYYPVLSGTNLKGALKLYSISDGSKILLDHVTVESGFMAYRQKK